jgi:indole-3-glycerol phosphate synthase/phosphoribosylanthranilate isomerase
MIEGVLGEIVARKRIDVAQRLAGRSLDSLREAARPTERSLRAALARPGARFVMEVKRVSPSQGALRTDVDPAAIAGVYRGAADAVSVLTDAPYFGGSLDDLRVVRAAFDGPILAKDFVVDARQVAEARIAGADAVLVMLSVLDDAEAAAVMDEARRLGMDALVEAHDEAEVRRGVALGAAILGINNRDLKTLKVDLAVTERLAGLVPEGILLVSESGIENRGDVARLAPFADAFLVGSSLMRAADPALAARALAYGRVKVCGLTQAADAAAAADAGASFAGLIMVPGTPRAVTVEQAQAAVEGLAIRRVGVFRNAKPAAVAQAAQTLRLHAVQLHGSEDAPYISGLRSLLPEGTQIWAAAAVGGAAPKPRSGADRTVYDTGSGGTGRTFDWSRVAGRPELGEAILAGGLTPANARAAAAVGAWALDVSSGVEAAPGRKHPAKLAAFFDALRVPVRQEAT